MGLHQKSWTFSSVSQSYWEKLFIISSLSEIPKLMLCLGCISFKRNIESYVSGLRQMGIAGAAIRPCFPPALLLPSLHHMWLHLSLSPAAAQSRQPALPQGSAWADTAALHVPFCSVSCICIFLSWILLAFCPRSALSNSCWPPVRLISASCQLVICSGKLEQLTLDKAVKVGIISCKYIWE